MSTDFFLLHDIMKKKGSECVCIREREKERERDERERERVTYQNGQFFFFRRTIYSQSYTSISHTCVSSVRV